VSRTWLVFCRRFQGLRIRYEQSGLGMKEGVYARVLIAGCVFYYLELLGWTLG